MAYKFTEKKVISVDKKTGKEIDGVIVICNLKRNPYAGGWVMNSQEALRILATDKDLKGETYRVLLYLLSILDFENWIQIQQKEIANELQMHKQHINRAIKLLENKEIILRGEKSGRSYSFRLNPHFGWKGKVKNLDEYRKEKDNQESRELINKTKTKTTTKKK